MTITFERVRGFQPPWRTVAVYTCDNGHVSRLRVPHHGPPPRGAVMCSAPGCAELLPLSRMPTVRG